LATRRRRFAVERLEDRAVLASFTSVDAADLIADIDAANQTPEADTIALVAGTDYTLTTVNNYANPSTGLPTIAAGEDLTIVGNGAVIERSSAAGTPAFRLLDVAAGATLTLENLTLQGGWANSSSIVWSIAAGGAIYNAGALTLNGVTVQNNTARGYDSLGGGIYSSGSLVLENSIIQNNQALGGRGSAPYCARGGCSSAGDGGSAFGGGLFISGGTALLTDVVLSDNIAQGGDGGDGFRSTGRPCYRCGGGAAGGNGGNGFGGGLYAAGGTVTLRETIVTSNAAKGGAAGQLGDTAGQGVGGGLYIETDAIVCLDTFTAANVKRNRASTSDRNIHGSFTPCL